MEVDQMDSKVSNAFDEVKKDIGKLTRAIKTLTVFLALAIVAIGFVAVQ